MANPRFAWGIDIGNRALKAVKLVRDGDLFRVDDFEFIEHETVLSQAGDNRESLIQTALANFVQRHNFKGGVVSIGVSGQASFARFVKLPPVEEKKIPEIVRFEAVQQIPFPLEDVEWSYQLFRQPDNPEVEVGIFAMRRELVNQHIKYFTDFNLNVQAVQMNPLAVYNAMHYDARFNEGLSMIVDVGTDNTDLLIADNDRVWMRSIPIGGSNFTEALVKAFKLNFAKAEDLKRNAATSKYARQIFQHMRPVFADLVAEIQRSIGFYSSVHRDAKLVRIYALGGTFKLPGLQKYLQQNLQLPVDRIDSLSAGAPSDPKQAAIFGDNLLSIVGAYGLGVQAMGGSAITSSLLPKAIQRERIWQDKTKWFGLAAGLFLAGTTVAGARWFFDNLQYTNASDVRQQNQEVLNKAKANSDAWATHQGAGEQERTYIYNLQALIQGNSFWRDFLADMVNTLPQPQGALKAALESGKADEIKKIERSKRRIIQIDEITPVYVPTLTKNLEADQYFLANEATKLATQSIAGNVGAFTPPAPMMTDPNNPITVDPNGKGRGFIVLIRFTCPLADAPAFVERDVQRVLMNLKPSASKPNMKYAVRKFHIVSSLKVGQNTVHTTRLINEHSAATALKEGNVTGAVPGMTPTGGGYGGGGGFGGGGFGGGGFGGGGFRDPRIGSEDSAANFGGGRPLGGGGAVARGPDASVNDTNNPAFQDRITGESVLADTDFTIAVAVELDPDPYAPAAPAQAASN